MIRHALSLRLRFVVFMVACLAATANAQLRAPREIALDFLRTNPLQFNLAPEDVAAVRVTDEYRSNHNGVTHVWVQQEHAGIPVYNALFGLHVRRDGQVAHLGHRFVPGLAQKVNTTLPSLAAPKALEMAMANLGFSGFPVPRLKEKINARNWIFEGGAISRRDIPVSAVFQPMPDGSVRLAWVLEVDQANTSDVWNFRVDAQTGLVLGKDNRTVYCNAGMPHATDADCSHEQPAPLLAGPYESAPPTLAGESYRVFALPVEAPNFGDRTLVENPAVPAASPFGWHDTNGAAGAEFTYTRGNNVWAYNDAVSDNKGDPAESAQGGSALIFDFPYDINATPQANANAAITNLFYVSNMMHDLTYLYGFDEESGSFQVNNYGKNGKGDDPVLAEAIDGSGFNNANFSPQVDGTSGRMQMYIWERRGNLVRANAPNAVLGAYYAIPADGWGKPVTSIPVTGDAVVVDDASSDPNLGCYDIQNDVNGKIAIIDRGGCTFAEKAVKAQAAGAIGCIVCNYLESPQGMSADATGNSVTIPVVMIGSKDCQLLRQFAGNGLNISLVLPPAVGPDYLDGDFDNGIIAHEYTHGISNRLTGGPSTAGCLGNAENMGEGWSDFLALVVTTKPGDKGTDKRPVATFVSRQATDASGLRRFPYSTDMSINPLTYGTLAENPETHALGEAWTSVLWDLYWAMVEKYGYDADFNNKASGNGRALQLVMDGMKLQPCGPGFVDGRDAILLADQLYYDGVDTCLISSVFARRGLGYLAFQGSNNSGLDGIENFDPIPTCVKTVKITKETTTPTLEPGQNAEFIVRVYNHKDETLTNVVITDELPNGLTLLSATNGGAASNGMVKWTLPVMAPGTAVELKYTAKTDETKGSVRYFRNKMESEDDWVPFYTKGQNSFFAQTSEVKTGVAAFRANALATESDMSLEILNPVTISGNKPVLRFWQLYNTETGADVGILEFQKVGETSWTRVPADKTIRNGYTGKVQYETFVLPYLYGFSGISDGWEQSYFDMSDFVGQDISFRFRFATDEAITLINARWVVDDVELLDMFNYNSAVCVSTDQGDLVCTQALESGVIMNPAPPVATGEAQGNAFGLQVQPNPAHDLLHVSIETRIDGDLRAALFSADGRMVLQRSLQGLAEGQVLSFDVQALPAGLYLLRLDSGAGSSVAKVIIR